MTFCKDYYKGKKNNVNRFNVYFIKVYTEFFFRYYIYVYRYVYIHFYVYMCIIHINLIQGNEAESIARQIALYLNNMKEKRKNFLMFIEGNISDCFLVPTLLSIYNSFFDFSDKENFSIIEIVSS